MCYGTASPTQLLTSLLIGASSSHHRHLQESEDDWSEPNVQAWALEQRLIPSSRADAAKEHFLVNTVKVTRVAFVDSEATSLCLGRTSSFASWEGSRKIYVSCLLERLKEASSASSLYQTTTQMFIDDSARYRRDAELSATGSSCTVQVSA